MPRRLRLDFPGAQHHVMNRGARRAPIFQHPGARTTFLSLLEQLPARFGLGVHAFAVMPNHYHLLVTSPDGGLAPPMKWLDQVFTQRLNREPKWDGPVFRGRYHDVLVADPRHWRHLAAYVHLNPLEHGGPTRLHDPRWTSHAAFLGRVATPPWLDPGPLLAAHGGREGYLAYVDGIAEGTTEPPEGFDPLCFRGELTCVAPTGPATDPQEALAQVARVVGRPVPRDGGSRDPIVGVAAWWLRANGADLTTCGALLGISPSRASHRMNRTLERAETDPCLASWMAALSGVDRRAAA